MLKKLLVVAGLSLAIVGCASVKMADPTQDAQAKQFAAKPDVAGVYVYRNEQMGSAYKIEVDLDGKPLGITAPDTYIYTEVRPGTHTLTSKAENTSELTFEAAAGKLYYVWQEMKMGILYFRTKLQLVDEVNGQKGVQETKLAAPLSK
ncbi:hypothetical protein OYT1_ch1022 [Ferriphaselus amnicola]|uniref:DUF2846 domain-containing protein n=1 Tax=Ferriphaselus amnicola TaxID=1188319 RepID=A0A2Z6GAR4_9PROT|nr:DUF2846 domain-containing protein [Ferriphaselus amnicola]BBE50583.1 hypothetical protein OYT1_ch1022 [Ferriphaselus amnicola]